MDQFLIATPPNTAEPVTIRRCSRVTSPRPRLACFIAKAAEDSDPARFHSPSTGNFDFDATEQSGHVNGSRVTLDCRVPEIHLVASENSCHFASAEGLRIDLTTSSAKEGPQVDRRRIGA